MQSEFWKTDLPPPKKKFKQGGARQPWIRLCVGPLACFHYDQSWKQNSDTPSFLGKMLHVYKKGNVKMNNIWGGGYHRNQSKNVDEN